MDRFTVYLSNNLKVSDDTVSSTAVKCTNVIFGHKKALTFASQMTSMETLPNPSDFGKLIRGLNVYGRKVIDENAIGHLYAMRG